MVAVAINGVGVVSPLGVGKTAFQQALKEDRCGIGDLTLFDPPGQCEHAGEIGEGYNWKEQCFSKQTFADRCTGLAMGAARLALEDAGLGLPLGEDAETVGFCFGTRWGCMEASSTFYQPVSQGKGKRASSLVFSHSYPNCPTSFVAIELGLRGYSTSFAGSTLAGVWALRSAFDAIQSGAAGQVLVGASDALSPAAMGHEEARGHLPDTQGKTPPASASAMEASWQSVPAEGAAFLLLSDGRSGLPVLGHITAIAETDQAATALDLRFGNTQAAAPLFDLVVRLLQGEGTTRSVYRDGAGVAVEIARGDAAL